MKKVVKKKSSPKKPAGKKKPTSEVITPSPEKSFYVVGIGASAGGLEALERFFGNMPENTGMAFIVVSHLDPTSRKYYA